MTTVYFIGKMNPLKLGSEVDLIMDYFFFLLVFIILGSQQLTDFPYYIFISIQHTVLNHRIVFKRINLNFFFPQVLVIK